MGFASTVPVGIACPEPLKAVTTRVNVPGLSGLGVAGIDSASRFTRLPCGVGEADGVGLGDFVGLGDVVGDAELDGDGETVEQPVRSVVTNGGLASWL